MAAPASAAAAAGLAGMSTDNAKGLVLAVSSSAFIGASFIVKKMGLRRAADSGVRAGYGGFSYLMEPLWWIGMISMIVGEIANFAAYAFAPAILVTPLGALSIIISAALAHAILQEKLHTFGILGCVLCVVGSITIVLHAPQERNIDSVREVWDLATEPGFLCYAAIVVAAALVLIYFVVPQHGQTNIMVYIGVCSLLGSLTVMSVKALGIALKLTFSGVNQLFYPQTWAFALIVATCVSTQINYLNKALDTFNTAVVSPIYYVMFTSLTILASVIMFKDWDRQNPTQIVTELCGFVTILSGTFLLHKTKDMTDSTGPSLPTSRSKSASQNRFSIEVVPLKYRDSVDEETLPLSLPKADNRYLMEDFPVRYKDLNIT
uniref:Probable magnesium transporter n=1 Tax=Oryza meridionalis TaxID=40149 RepID=A0A0E0DYI9_9ORYZ